MRADSDLSQDDLAKLLNVSKQAIEDWERCSKVPDMDILFKLANILHRTVIIAFETDSNIAYG